MARHYQKTDALNDQARQRHNVVVLSLAIAAAAIFVCVSSAGKNLGPLGFMLFGALIPAIGLGTVAATILKHRWLENERRLEEERRGGAKVLGTPPDRTAFQIALDDARERGKVMIDRYLVGFELDSGKPIWVTDDEICGHGAVFAKTGYGKTLWLEGLMFQQMARGRASGFTFIDAKRDPGTLADIIMMALITGRIEDLIVVDPFDPVCAYNFVFTTQRPDVKARKVLRCGLPPTSDQSTTKHYDRLAADAVYRAVRAMESLGLAWSVRDIAVALSAFNVAYPRLRSLLHEHGAKQAMVELGHLASSYRTAKGSLDPVRLTDNLRGIASELHSISNSEAGEMFCTPRADLSLTDAILRGKMIYYMLPRLEEAESAARMVKVFREDLEVSIGEVTSSRSFKLEDPHLVIIDEGASTFGPTWANLFELARKGRFGLIFGAQSVGGLMDQTMGLSEEFYERVMANVNLKVIMRVGDNRTAEDMSEWIGMIKTNKKTIATGVSTSISAREYTKHLEVNKKAADAYRDGITVSEDEEELVSTEELKHEMSAEKGLAWFDKGDGIVRKGRSIWFESDLPPTWEGRELLTKYESVEADEIGLAEWVDEHIFTIEEAESERALQGLEALMGGPSLPPTTPGTPSAVGTSTPTERVEEPEEPSGPFRFNMLRPFKGRNRANTFFAKTDEPPSESVKFEEKAPNSESRHNTVDAAPGNVTPPLQAIDSRESKSRVTNGEDAGPVDPSKSANSKPQIESSKRGGSNGERGKPGNNSDRSVNVNRNQVNEGNRNKEQRDRGAAKGDGRGHKQADQKLSLKTSSKDTVVKAKKIQS